MFFVMPIKIDSPKIYLINFKERVLGKTVKNLIKMFLIKYKTG